MLPMFKQHPTSLFSPPSYFYQMPFTIFIQSSILTFTSNRMNILKSLFSSSPFTCFMHQNLPFSPRSLPETLVQQLGTPKGQQEFQNYLRSPYSAQKQIKVIGLLALLFLRSSQFYCIVEESLDVQYPTSDWLISKIFIPFKNILKRCSETFEQFQAAKRREFKKQNAIRRLVYLIRLLRQCCLIGLQLPKLGRYFVSKKDANTELYQFLGQTYMLFLDQLYTAFKFNLSNYLRNLSKQLDSIQFTANQHLLKWIVAEVLPQLNQTIQDINSNKYFMFAQKGYIVQLFDAAAQSSAVQKFINQRILAQCDSNNTKQRTTRQKTALLSQKEMSAGLPNLKQINRKFSQNSTDSSNKSSPIADMNPEIYQFNQE